MSPAARKTRSTAKSRGHLVAIDQGTTGSTVLIVDPGGRVRGHGYTEFPQHYPHPGWVEHDADEIWKSVLSALRKASKQVGSRGALSVAAIGITNQRETTVLWSRRTGRAVGRAIVWQDRRTSEICEQLRRARQEPVVKRRTGLLLDPYFSGTKLTWLFRRDRKLAIRARAGDIAFGTVDSWLIWKLTGGQEHVTDFTNASRTLLFNIGRRRWDPELLKLMGVPAEVLPEVRVSSGLFGRTSRVPGIPDGTPILGVAGDQQAALYGQGCVRPGDIKNTYGTGAFLLMNTGKKRVASRSGLLTTLACDAGGLPVYALEGSVFIAGAVVQWLRDEMKLLKHASESEALAQSVPDSAGTVFVPAFVGLGAPYWKPDARGAWFGVTRGTTRAHLVRSALESIAFQSRDVFDAMVKDSRRRPRSLRVDGGAAVNDFLMQFQSDLLGVPVERPRHLESTALGAVALAANALGLWRGGKMPGDLGKIDRRFRPKSTHPRRDALYAGWQSAVAKLLS